MFFRPFFTPDSFSWCHSFRSFPSLIFAEMINRVKTWDCCIFATLCGLMLDFHLQTELWGLLVQGVRGWTVPDGESSKSSCWTCSRLSCCRLIKHALFAEYFFFLRKLQHPPAVCVASESLTGNTSFGSFRAVAEFTCRSDETGTKSAQITRLAHSNNLLFPIPVKSH